MNKAKDIAKETIDSILENDFVNTSQEIAVPENKLPEYREKRDYNKSNMSKAAENEAKLLLDSLLKFYLSQNLIENSDYINARARLEVSTMAGLIKQLNIAENAIDILMEEISVGNVQPRMFEVLANLQKTMLGIMKHQTMQIITTEEVMKKLKRDVDIHAEEAPMKLEQNKSGNYVVRGSRNLMMDIQSEIEEDVEID